MTRFIERLRDLFALRLGRFLATPHVEAIVKRLLSGHVDGMASDNALRLYLGLHAHIEFKAGQLAILYGNGIHTKHKHMRYYDFFTARIPEGSKVLDVGCGNGALSYAIASRCRADVLAFDIVEANIEMAKCRFAHPGVDYRVADILDETLTGTVDVVVMSNVLEHLPHRPDLLRRIQEQWRPARFLIRVPMFERDWIVPLKQEIGLDWRDDPTHQIEYSHETFNEEMRLAGLRILGKECRWGEIWAELARPSLDN